MRFLLVLLLLLSTAMPALAHSPGEYELYGGLSRHTITQESPLFGHYSAEIKTKGPGNGWYVGGRYWFNDKWAGGLMYERIETGRSTVKTFSGSSGLEVNLASSTAVSGVLLTGAYEIATGDNWNALVQLGVGSYNVDKTLEFGLKSSIIDFSHETDLDIASSIGYTISGQFSTFFNEQTSLDVIASYLTLSTKVKKPDDEVYLAEALSNSAEENLDVSVNSWSIGVGVTYHF